MKRAVNVFLIIGMLFLSFGTMVFAQDEEIIKWSEPKTAVYDKLHPHTLNWSQNVLDRGGLVLSSMEITTSPSEADFVINQYGAIGASGILKFPNDTLESDTKTSISGFTNSLNIEKGAIYLIVLHDGSFAKIRIDRFLPEQGISITKVFFTYVTEKERVKTSQVGAVGNDLPNDVFPGNNFGDENISENIGSGSNTSAGAQSGGTGEFSPPGDNQAGAPGGSNAPSDEGQLEFPFSIYLFINSADATIYQKNFEKIQYRLHTVPFIYEGRTMVPLRFVAEALGATVGWNEEDSSVSITSSNLIISLWLGEQQAIVNGEIYDLDVAPFTKDSYTMVPLRFISENMGMYVYYNGGMILITDTENTTFETAQAHLYDFIPTQESHSNVDALLGLWGLWVPGGFAAGQYVHGAYADWIQINSDGTYTWLDLNTVYEGTWSTTGSENHIIIHGGPLDSDWHMSLVSSGEVKIYAWGLEYKGTRID
ncbi:MAG: copper amine oxidase N-terminal domain-containing protein [Eubacteriales bacterium]|jgi:hypothetical protein|nr:copper amine oxidase N-terminal domain-containing protein [Eubacteriales bacterium]